MTNKSFLEKIKTKVYSLYPNARIIQFGSRARNSALKDSDWDILILLDKTEIDKTDFDKVSFPIIELGWNYGEQVSPKLYTFDDWKKRNFTPFYKNVEKEGIVL